MYPNITKYFNQRAKKWALAGIVYCGLSLLSLVASVIINFISGNISGAVTNSLGILFHAVLFILFLNIMGAQTTLKTAFIGKMLKQQYSLNSDAIAFTLRNINEEINTAEYLDNTQNYSFIITDNWVIGCVGMFSRAYAVKLGDIKEIQKLDYHYKNAVTYQIVLKLKNDEFEHKYTFLSELQRDEASYALSQALKRFNY